MIQCALFNSLKRISITFTIVSLGLSLTSCSRDNTSNVQNINPEEFAMSRWYSRLEPSANSSIEVFNENNQPLSQATILIGLKEGQPFPGNIFQTDSNGIVNIPADLWVSAAHVTIDAPGYIRQTLLNQLPGLLQIKLKKTYLYPKAIVKGEVTQLPIENKDKMMDFGIVIPAVTKADFIGFSLDSVISPIDDKITVIGNEVKIPTNVSLPKQKESYILPITLEKPEHRVFVNQYGPKTFFALTGRFPFKPVVSELKDGKKFYEVLNLFDFTSGSLRDHNVAGPVSILNLPAGEIKFNSLANVKGASIMSDEVQVTMALNSISGKLVPSDVKRISAKETLELKTVANKPVYIVSLLKKQNDFNPMLIEADQTSASILLYESKGLQTTLLPLINPPVVEKNNGSITVRLPSVSTETSNKAQVYPIALSAIISNLIEIKDGNEVVIIEDRQWEIIGNQWPNEFILPSLPIKNQPGQRRKIDINLIGSNNQSEVNLGDDLINAATHFTHSAAEL
ncbi:MAG: hypothetical protein ACK4VO_10850 [Pseudobdellovibrio sp.]